MGNKYATVEIDMADYLEYASSEALIDELKSRQVDIPPDRLKDILYDMISDFEQRDRTHFMICIDRINSLRKEFP